MGKTKKTGVSATFGARYGSNVRKKWKLIMEQQNNKKLKCPRCETEMITRKLKGKKQVFFSCPNCHYNRTSRT